MLLCLCFFWATMATELGGISMQNVRHGTQLAGSGKVALPEPRMGVFAASRSPNRPQTEAKHWDRGASLILGGPLKTRNAKLSPHQASLSICLFPKRNAQKPRLALLAVPDAEDGVPLQLQLDLPAPLRAAG